MITAVPRVALQGVGHSIDSEGPIIVALRTCGSEASHPQCQKHVLGNLAESVLEVNVQLRQGMRGDHSADLAMKPVRQDDEC